MNLCYITYMNEEEIEDFEYNEDPESLASDGASGEEDCAKKVLKLKSELKQAKKEKEEYLTGWQKERADFANYKKDETERSIRYKDLAREQILESFLRVADSFAMAFANKEAWEKVDSNWRQGVEYIYAQMSGVFEEYGVTELGKVGEVFDPNIHEPVEMVAATEKDMDHKIANVIQKGYKLGSRVLRPARVNVYEYKN